MATGLKRTITITSVFQTATPNLGRVQALAAATDKLGLAERRAQRGRKAAEGGLKSFRLRITRLRIAYFNFAVLLGTAAFAIRAMVKPAIELESELANVRKTTNLSAEGISDLKDNLIDMSKRIPLSAKELGNIASVAGQLGIRGVENITAFTQTIGLMAIATNLTAEEAAKALGKISNAFDVPISSANKLSSVINELSNTTAANSKEIVSSLTRIGAAGANLGITVDFAAALASTLIDAGFRAERAGSRIRRALTSFSIKNPEIRQLFKGEEIKEFDRLLQTDTNQAILMVLKRFKDLGIEADQTKEIMGIFGRVGGFAVQTLVENYDDLVKNADLANREFEEGLSLIKEFSLQTSTTSNQIKLLSNEFKSLVLNNQGPVNFFIRSIRKGLIGLNIELEQKGGFKTFARRLSKGALTGLAPGLGFLNTFKLDKGDEKRIQGALEKTRDKLEEAYGEDTFKRIDKIIQSQDELEDKYAVALNLLALLTAEYGALATEIDLSLNNLDEQNNVLNKGSVEWQKAKDTVEDAKREIIATGSVSEETRDKLDSLNETIKEINKETAITPNRFESVSEAIKEVAEAQQQLADAKTYEEILDANDRLIFANEKLVDSFDDITQKSIKDYINSLKDAGEATKDLEDRISDLNKEIKDRQNAILSMLSSQLKDVRKEIGLTTADINKILNRRFTIGGISETNIESIIKKQELELKKAEFAALGLGTAEEFLRKATEGSTEEIDEQTEAINRLNEASATGEDRFNAWQTTLRETIRSLVLSSQDLDKDVTDVVRKAQTELLGISQFEDAKDTGDEETSALEDNIDRLRSAQDIFFGEEKLKLNTSERLREDRINGVNTSAAEAIAALNKERTSLEELQSQEQSLADQQDELRKEMKGTTGTIKDQKLAIDDLRQSIADLQLQRKTNLNMTQQSVDPNIGLGSGPQTLFSLDKNPQSMWELDTPMSRLNRMVTNEPAPPPIFTSETLNPQSIASSSGVTIQNQTNNISVPKGTAQDVLDAIDNASNVSKAIAADA